MGSRGKRLLRGVRLKTEAEPNEILVSPQTHRLIAPYFETEELPAVRVKGKAELLRPYRALRPLPVRSRFEASARRGFTRYTGRQDELAVLHGCLQRTIRGEGQFITVMGEAGVGKSRLLHEFISSLDREHVSVLQGTCHAHGSTTSYLPFLDTLRRELNVVEGRSREEVLDTAVATLTALGPSLKAYLPFYLHLLSIRTDPMIAHMQGPELRHAMQEALTGLIMAKAERQPTLLFLEDWHWHDEASEAVIQHLLTLMGGHSLLVGITYRSECSIDWSDAPHYTPMRVPPLDSPHTEDIAKSVWKAASIPSDVKTLLYERTGGNPLFIEEACHALFEEGAVLIRDGHAVLTRSLKEIALPHTVQAIIRSRLDRLSADLKETLHLASVIGRVFEQRILERLYHGRTALADVIATLRSMEMISTVSDAPGTEYIFKHVLTQEVTYDTLLLTRRRQLHLLVGHSIEELCGDRIAEQVNVLYHHYRLAESWEKAVQYGRFAAEKAQKLSQFEEAVKVLEDVEQCLLYLPEEAGREETLIDCLLQKERLYDTLGWRERQHGVIEQMLSLLKEKEQPARLAAVYLRQGDLYTQVGRFEEAGTALEEAITLRQQLGDKAGESNALRSLSFLRWHQGCNEEAVACNEMALDIDRVRGDRKAISHDLTNLAAVLQNHGDHDGALAYLQEALELEEAQRDLFNRMTILYNIANVHSRSGAFDQALTFYQESLQVCVEHRLLINQTLVLSCIASIRWQQGNTDECLRLYHEAVDISRHMKYGQGLSNGLRALSDLLLVLERHQEALSCMVESIAVCAELGDLKNQAVSLSIAAMTYERVNKDYGQAVAAWIDVRKLKKQMGDLRGELEALQQMGRVVRLQRNEPAEALPYFEDALELADRLGDRHTQGHLLNTVGILEWG
ncbi:MAG: tetratricopeptide repeat protein [Nitrospirales bacterium]